MQSFKSSLAASADRRACRALIRNGSKSFYAASMLLPQRVREPAFALYAFCRISDDAVDDADAAADAVERLRARLDAAYRGAPDENPVDRAFAEMVATFELPRALPDALLDGLAWDTEGRTYRTLSDLNAYSARVAGTVGAMMTVIMGVREPRILARACDLGVAMQLTNIARDIGEDARNGRLYLPLVWLEEAGIDAEAFTARPAFDERLAAVTARLLEAADKLYDRALPGIAGLPADCRPAIHAARLIYREIGRVVADNRFDSVTTRAVVPNGRKLALMARALASSMRDGTGDGAPALHETAFLVDSVPPSLVAAGPGAAGRQNPFSRMLELLERVEQRERLLHQSPSSGP